MFKVIAEKLGHYARLTRADKPIGALLLLWPMLWALWIASSGQPDSKVLLVFLAGTFLMRSAGCAINDYADRDFDGAVARTRNRPIVSGDVSPKEALLVAAALALISFALVLTMNRLTVLMSVIGLALAAVYPFTKRLFHGPQLVLGLAFGWAVPMAWAAQTNQLSAMAWLIYLIAILWAIAYDTIYAMVDRDDDLKIGIKSTAIWFGRRDVAVVMGVLGAVLALIAWAGYLAGLGWVFAIGWIVAVTIAGIQFLLIRSRVPADCFRAFHLNNHLGLAIFLGIALDYFI
jgi:4-hydroxybenzoate polyprenyltransferase